MVERTPRLVGEARQAMAAELAGRYHDGASIRSLARESGRSYGLVPVSYTHLTLPTSDLV